MSQGSSARGGQSTPPAATARGTHRRDMAAEEPALPRATSLVNYYMSTTPSSSRTEKRNLVIGSPADFSGIYSVWKSPAKQATPGTRGTPGKRAGLPSPAAAGAHSGGRKARDLSRTPQEARMLQDAALRPPEPGRVRLPADGLSPGREAAPGARTAQALQFDAYPARSNGRSPVRGDTMSPQEPTYRTLSRTPHEIHLRVPTRLDERPQSSVMAGDEDVGGEVPGLGLVVGNKSLILERATERGLTQNVTVCLVQIQQILPNSIASMCEAMSPGDEILSVNSMCCRGHKWEAIASIMTPGRLPTRQQTASRVHIIVRQCQGTARTMLRREALYHASLDVSRTTWRYFPSISFVADTWSPSCVRTFLEWVFWREDETPLFADQARVPSGMMLLSMPDQEFCDLGFSHDEIRTIRCILGVLRGIAQTQTQAHWNPGNVDA